MTRKILLITIAALFTVNVLGQFSTPDANGKIYYNGGNVGIGTDNPKDKLEIYGGGNLLIKGANNDAGDLIFQTNSELQLGRVWSNNGGISGLYLSSGDNIADITIHQNGNVGIGTTAPSATLDVNGNSVYRGDINLTNFDLSWSLNQIDLNAAPRTQLNPMSLRLWDHYSFPNDPQGIKSYGTVLEIYGRPRHQTSQLFFGYDGIIRHRSASYNSNWSSWRRILDTEHSIESSGNMKITGSGNHYISNGNVGIGTTNPTYKLAVKGTIGCGEIKVENTAGWPDFVFEPNYNLRTLKELETYIQKNNHLPEIPTTAEVKENGISLGEMDKLLLQKIEELTLYVIDLKKENEDLKDKVEILMNK